MRFVHRSWAFATLDSPSLEQRTLLYVVQQWLNRGLVLEIVRIESHPQMLAAKLVLPIYLHNPPTNNGAIW